MTFLPDDFAWFCLFVLVVTEHGDIYTTLLGEPVDIAHLIHLSEIQFTP